MALASLDRVCEFLRFGPIAVVLTVRGPELRCDGCDAIESLTAAELLDRFIDRVKAYQDAHAACRVVH